MTGEACCIYNDVPQKCLGLCIDPKIAMPKKRSKHLIQFGICEEYAAVIAECGLGPEIGKVYR